MGPKTRDILNSLQVEEVDFSEFNHITQKFDGYFIHPANELYESARFDRRIQQAGESANSSFTVLRNFVKKCNYPSCEVEERLIRDRFVVGLRDVKLSDRFCCNPRLTLKEALIQVCQVEDAKGERKFRGSTGASAASAEAKAISIDAARVTGNCPPKSAATFPSAIRAPCRAGSANVTFIHVLNTLQAGHSAEKATRGTTSQQYVAPGQSSRSTARGLRRLSLVPSVWTAALGQSLPR